MHELPELPETQPRLWSTFHRCGHCPYVHRPVLTTVPLPGEWFEYFCPIVGCENRFAYGDPAVPPWRLTRLDPQDPEERHPRAHRISAQ